jgi:hypothetical protein
MSGGDSVWFLFCGTAILAVSFGHSTGEDARATNQTEPVWFLFCGTAILAVSFDHNTGEDARATNQTEPLPDEQTLEIFTLAAKSR